MAAPSEIEYQERHEDPEQEDTLFKEVERITRTGSWSHAVNGLRKANMASIRKEVAVSFYSF